MEIPQEIRTGMLCPVWSLVEQGCKKLSLKVCIVYDECFRDNDTNEGEVEEAGWDSKAMGAFCKG